jgi:uncharacterized Zn-finger protein
LTQNTESQDEGLVDNSSTQRIEVRAADLPLSCPLPDQKLWNSHPRVYLPIKDSGECTCPYCGTHYVLSD